MAGCTCSPYANFNGIGRYGGDGHVIGWAIDPLCPIHSDGGAPATAGWPVTPVPELVAA
jgi:hypothetical protein